MAGQTVFQGCCPSPEAVLHCRQFHRCIFPPPSRHTRIVAGLRAALCGSLCPCVKPQECLCEWLWQLTSLQMTFEFRPCSPLFIPFFREPCDGGRPSYPTSQIGYPTSLIGYPTSLIGYPTSLIGYPTSQIGYPTSRSDIRLQYRISDFSDRISDIGYPTSKIGYPMRNCAVLCCMGFRFSIQFCCVSHRWL